MVREKFSIVMLSWVVLTGCSFMATLSLDFMFGFAMVIICVIVLFGLTLSLVSDWFRWRASGDWWKRLILYSLPVMWMFGVATELGVIATIVAAVFGVCEQVVLRANDWLSAAVYWISTRTFAAVVIMFIGMYSAG